MATVYEDNFGFWNIDAPEERAFFEHVKRESVYVNCERCQRLVCLIPPKTFCASCACALECGAPFSMSEYDRDQPTILDPRRPPQRALCPEFGSFVRGEAIAAMSEWRRKGVRRANLKIVASDPDLAAIEKAVEALNTCPSKIFVVDTSR